MLTTIKLFGIPLEVYHTSIIRETDPPAVCFDVEDVHHMGSSVYYLVEDQLDKIYQLVAQECAEEEDCIDSHS